MGTPFFRNYYIIMEYTGGSTGTITIGITHVEGIIWPMILFIIVFIAVAGTIAFSICANRGNMYITRPGYVALDLSFVISKL